MRPGPAALGEILVEVNRPVEAQAAVLENIDVQGLHVSRGIHEGDVPGLDEVVGDQQVLLIGGEFDVVRS